MKTIMRTTISPFTDDTEVSTSTRTITVNSQEQQVVDLRVEAVNLTVEVALGDVTVIVITLPDGEISARMYTPQGMQSSEWKARRSA